MGIGNDSVVILGCVIPGKITMIVIPAQKKIPGKTDFMPSPAKSDENNKAVIRKKVLPTAANLIREFIRNKAT
jgi:hypothetical protein